MPTQPPEIQLYNTLTHRLERFEPTAPPRVYMYNCGPTVYDFAHIGNFRAFVFADVLRRFLELVGYDVRQVMNITDVGHMTEDQLADGAGQDKMQVAAERLKEAKQQGTLDAGEIQNPDDPYQVAEFYSQAFLKDARALNLKIASDPERHRPRATQYIQQMQAMIRKLIDAGHAYVADDGAVYYAVESFPDYGRLSGNTLEKLRGGAGGRVLDEHQQAKRHPADFLLWKPDPSHIMKWDSPWGTGYPGWHIECSTMATEVLGREVIDIHTGGEDNIFPHHECEIAQTCGATGQRDFARYWLHTRFLLVEGEKMSKSKGNFFTARDVLEGRVTGSSVDPAVLRYELMRAHYRANSNFTVKGVKEDAAGAVQRLRDKASELAQRSGGEAEDVGLDHPAVARFAEALADDLNVSGALAVLFDFLRESHADAAEALGAIRRMDSVLGLIGKPVSASTDLVGRWTLGGTLKVDDAPNEKCRQIDEARKAKDYATADRIRDELIAAGYDVRTTPEGTVASKRLA